MLYTVADCKQSARLTKVPLLAKHAKHCVLKLTQFHSLLLRANSIATGANYGVSTIKQIKV
jgi:hypothetical protein